jgi:hypothetical protein
MTRVVTAVEKVKERLHRTAGALDAAGIPYAIAGGNAVALWVSRVDESAVRNTRDVDVLLRRDDLERVKTALEAAGFVYRHLAGIDLFLDGPEGKPREAIHLIFASEQVRPEELAPNPAITEFEQGPHFKVLTLEALVQIKLTAFRDKDRMHLRDLIDVELVDAGWQNKLSAALWARLKELLDHPE